MKFIFSPFLFAIPTFLCLGCKAESVARAAAGGEEPKPTGHYCNLGAFTPAEAERHRALVPKLASSTTARVELADGYAFKFSGQFREAGEWLDGVRRCCPTVKYQLDFEPNAGVAWLRVTGTNGAKDFIREEFRPLFGDPR
jgi:hypothetical protein